MHSCMSEVVKAHIEQVVARPRASSTFYIANYIILCCKSCHVIPAGTDPLPFTDNITLDSKIIMLRTRELNRYSLLFTVVVRIYSA